MAQNRDIQVAICIATCRRSEPLRELLGGLASLTFFKVKVPQIKIVVVDNDKLASAREACTISSLWPITYVVEPRQGVTYARNRAIAEAGVVNFIAFIDDDEVPSPQWLDELCWMQAELNADVVSGPVLPRYAADVPEWVTSGGFFDRRIPRTGASRKACSTNNVLIASRVFERVPGFNDAFALSGAEDTYFFQQVRQTGFSIAWSQQAVVFEAVSANRGTVSWLLRREYQTGNGWVFCEAAADKSKSRWIIRFLKAWGHIAMGLANALWPALFLQRVLVVRSLQRVSLGLGMLAALLGRRFAAYRRVDADKLTGENVFGKMERTSES